MLKKKPCCNVAKATNPSVIPTLIELILGPIRVIGGNGQCIPHHILFDVDTKMTAAHMPIRKVCQMPSQIIFAVTPEYEPSPVMTKIGTLLPW